MRVDLEIRSNSVQAKHSSKNKFPTQIGRGVRGRGVGLFFILLLRPLQFGGHYAIHLCICVRILLVDSVLFALLSEGPGENQTSEKLRL